MVFQTIEKKIINLKTTYPRLEKNEIRYDYGTFE